MKLKLLLSTLFIWGTVHFFSAQENESVVGKNNKLSEIDTPPSFPGGIKALVEFFKNNINYPPNAAKDSVEGKSIISFVVAKDGSIEEVKVARKLSEECDAEAVRVVQSMPKWNPGIKDGLPVRVSYVLPITFQLAKEEKPTLNPAKDSISSPKKKKEVHIPPKYPGGVEALMTYLKQNIKYPKSESKSGIKGKVILTFTVNEEGNIDDVEVKRSLSPAFDFEAKRAVRKMPKWIPGTIDGKPVKIEYTLPVTFAMPEGYTPPSLWEQEKAKRKRGF